MTLTGPEFLLLYIGFAVLLIGVSRLVRGFFEKDAAGTVDTADPYRLALLRGGATEAVRLAVVRLLDGRWLRADLGVLTIRPEAPADHPSHPLEQRVLADIVARAPCYGYELYDTPGVKSWAEPEGAALVQAGLWAGRREQLARAGLVVLGVVVLVALATVRLELAHLRGRHNTGFLELLRVVAPIVCALVVWHGARTRHGDRLLADLRTLVAAVPTPERAPGGGALTPELVLVGAVLGLAALQPVGVASASTLFPRKMGGGCGAASCSSSCGSSCGGGCGGGCGG